MQKIAAYTATGRVTRLVYVVVVVQFILSLVQFGFVPVQVFLNPYRLF